MSPEPDSRSSPLAGRRVVLGVAGGIAAYKAVELCRLLVEAGAHVAPILTADATRFVGPVTFSAVASEPVRTSLWDSPEPSPHTSLGQSTDLIVVAPATARALAAYALGLSDDLLVATLLATRAPVVACPAMHTEMWEQPAVQANIELLRSRGVHMVGPNAGPLAGGDTGMGRLAEPAEILSACEEVLSGRGSAQERDLEGLRLLVTAGGTREPVDPVRFLGNRSSGKQGHAVAEEGHARGAQVVLVTTSSIPGPPGVEVVRVETASEMEAAVLEGAAGADVVVMAAAVADFRPKAPADHKLKKAEGVPEIVLEPTTDILATLGERRRPGQTLVGFAAETGDVLAAARQKLRAKRADLIVANDVASPGVGFEHDTNAVIIASSDGMELNVDLTGKRAVARAILDAVVEHRSRQ